MVASPITGKPANLLLTIPVSKIIAEYKNTVDINVSEFFKEVNEIFLYECADTKYRFFYPFNLDGNDHFYEQLQKFDWYYQEWKWDYDAAYPFVGEGEQVLDIGCGNGAFLEKLKLEKKCGCTGLEFNEKAIKLCESKGLRMFSDTIEVHAASNKNKYDVVCFFQVLEHISDINSFIQAAISCLKPGGKLIICVPNNNPYFYRFDDFVAMNMPPHHMGWWNEESLTNLGKWYKLGKVSVREETLNRYRYYARGYLKNKAGNNAALGVVGKLLYPFMAVGVYLMRRKIHVGHILSVFSKQQ